MDGDGKLGSMQMLSINLNQRGVRTLMTPGRLDCAGQVQDNYRTTTRHPHWQAGHLQTCNMIIQSVGSVQFCVENGHLLKTRMSNACTCYVGNACTCCVGVVWCEGNRVNHRTTDYMTSMHTGQVQDNYRTTTGQL